MVSITCIIKKTGKKFHNTAFVCFFSPRKQKNILCGFYNAVALPGDCHVALLLAMTLSALHGIKITLTKKAPVQVLNPCPLDFYFFNTLFVTPLVFPPCHSYIKKGLNGGKKFCSFAFGVRFTSHQIIVYNKAYETKF